MKNETARREIESLDYYLQNHTDDYSEESHTAMMMAIDALNNAVLEQIRAEIEQNMESTIGLYDDKTPLSEKPYVKLARNDARQECLQIIDKHIGG